MILDTGIPDDETEAEIYLTRLQEEFDEKMKNNLGDKYLPGNNDPDTIIPNDLAKILESIRKKYCQKENH